MRPNSVSNGSQDDCRRFGQSTSSSLQPPLSDHQSSESSIRRGLMHRDPHIVDHVDDIFDLLRIDDIVGQVIVDLVVSQVTLIFTLLRSIT